MGVGAIMDECCFSDGGLMSWAAFFKCVVLDFYAPLMGGHTLRSGLTSETMLFGRFSWGWIGYWNAFLAHQLDSNWGADPVPVSLDLEWVCRCLPPPGLGHIPHGSMVILVGPSVATFFWQSTLRPFHPFPDPSSQPGHLWPGAAGLLWLEVCISNVSPLLSYLGSLPAMEEVETVKIQSWSDEFRSGTIEWLFYENYRAFALWVWMFRNWWVPG